VPTAKAQVLGLPARLPMTKAQVLLPSADVLKASARVLTVQADGREDQFHRKTRKIHERFEEARQGWHICSIGNHLFFQAPFSNDIIGIFRH
jgi:hypothetical protein